MIKVAINSLPLQTGHQSRGIGFYTKYLLEHLRKLPQLNITEFAKISEVIETDVVHFPFFDLFFPSLNLNKKFPTIVTIHDVTPLVFPQHYPPGIKGKINLWRQKRALKQVKALITDSEASKQDIVKYLGVSPKKIFPIYLAPLPHFQVIKDKSYLETVRRKYHLPEKFLIYTGNVNWNKNLLNLAQACVEANVDLVLIGKSFESTDNLTHPEMKSYAIFLEKYASLSNFHLLGFVSDEDLAAITNLAQAQLLPSYYEGFGLPILEAQSCGIPIITSNISSMTEISGEGALLVNPGDVGQISQAIYRVYEDTEFRQDLIARGFKNRAKYSWEKVAEQTAQVYQQVVS